jgi:ferredoxin
MTMPRAELTFEDIGVTLDVPAGTRLIEVSEQAGAGILYGCREGDCGTCMMKIVSGAEYLSEPSTLEDMVLKDHFASLNTRLACQAQVLGGHVVVRPG